MTRPNLFEFATSELSQDAFICWLLSWANEEHKSSDPKLHQCATAMIEAMFDKHGKKPPARIDKVEIRKQDKRIDVLCIIHASDGEKYGLLIEDKTDTSDPSSKLKRYLKKVTNKPFAEQNIIPIYYKTGDQSDYVDVEKAGYKSFLRDDILPVLRPYKDEHPILRDYLNHLQSIEDEVNSYTKKPVEEWKKRPRAWVGFFKELQKRLDAGEWTYVPNPQGGFIGFWWHDKGEAVKGTPYLLLDKEKLCFKICVEDKSERVARRDYWHKALIEEKDSSVHSLNLSKPPRFGAGRNMTVCIDKDYRVSGSGGLIDIKKTVEKLKEAERLIDAVRAKYRFR